MRKDSERHLKGITLSPTAFAIYFYIAANKASITQISSHPYFRYVSLSTVKRAISELKTKKLITVTTDSKDKRIKRFNITGEK